jgi:uncharacterized protein (UPF0332 family)
MNDKKSLFLYRMTQADETIAEAQKMFDEKFTPRSIINRAYYAMFYIVLALFHKNEIHIKTSKHTGIITVFDKEFIQKEKIDKKYSKILHSSFLARLENDYKEITNFSDSETESLLNGAIEFVNAIKEYITES